MPADPETLAAIQTVIGLVETLIGIQSAPEPDPRIQTILDGVTGLRGSMVAVEHETSIIDADVGAVQTTATNIGTKVDEIYTLVEALGGPVTLPTTPPTGYGGLGSDDVTDAVWNAVNTRSWGSNTFGAEWSRFTNITFNEAKYTLRTPWENAEWWVYGPWDLPASAIPSDAPTVLWSNILQTDTLISWLTREAPGYTWFDDGSFGPFVYTLSNSDSQFIFVYKISNQEWPFLLRKLFPAAAGASGWPGLALVTLGTPVALDVGFIVTGPMHGVLVEITDAPTKQGFFTFDTVKSWRNVGAIAFGDDDAGEELPQTLGFESAVYTPRAIAQPTKLIGRCSAGVAGTCTPWVRV